MVAQPGLSFPEQASLQRLVDDVHDDLEAGQKLRVDGNAVKVRGHAYGGGVHQDAGGATPDGVQGDGFGPQVFD